MHTDSLPSPEFAVESVRGGGVLWDNRLAVEIADTLSTTQPTCQASVQLRIPTSPRPDSASQRQTCLSAQSADLVDAISGVPGGLGLSSF